MTITQFLSPNLHVGTIGQITLKKFDVGMLVYVLPSSGLPNALYAGPEALETALFEWLQPGEIVEIIAGPFPARSMTFWKIKSLSRDLTGWSSEGLDEEQFLAPIPLRKLCDDALPSRLKIGFRSRVIRTKSFPVPILSTLKPDGINYVDTLFSGDEVCIVDGPVCWTCEHGRSQPFWQVRLKSGLTGWVAECDDQMYWLEPLSVITDEDFGALQLATP